MSNPTADKSVAYGQALLEYATDNFRVRNVDGDSTTHYLQIRLESDGKVSLFASKRDAGHDLQTLQLPYEDFYAKFIDAFFPKEQT